MDEKEKGRRGLGPFSRAVQERKEELYDKVPFSLKTVSAVAWIAGILLGIVVILIVLEAAGVFRLSDWL